MEAIEAQNGPWMAVDQWSQIAITLMRSRIWIWIRPEVKSWIRNGIKVKSWIWIRISVFSTYFPSSRVVKTQAEPVPTKKIEERKR
jgi:hypothetical protein